MTPTADPYTNPYPLMYNWQLQEIVNAWPGQVPGGCRLDPHPSYCCDCHAHAYNALEELKRRRAED